MYGNSEKEKKTVSAGTKLIDDCARIDRTKMTLDTANFLLEYLVPESRLKFTLTRRRRSDTHCLLSTAQKHL
jgi:hypothetical protein